MKEFRKGKLNRKSLLRIANKLSDAQDLSISVAPFRSFDYEIAENDDDLWWLISFDINKSEEILFGQDKIEFWRVGTERYGDIVCMCLEFVIADKAGRHGDIIYPCYVVRFGNRFKYWGIINKADMMRSFAELSS